MNIKYSFRINVKRGVPSLCVKIIVENNIFYVFSLCHIEFSFAVYPGFVNIGA